MRFPAALLALLFSASALSQTRIIVPFPPGGGADALARLMAPKLSEIRKEQVIVENKPGASGHIGADLVAQSPADGKTLLMSSTASLTQKNVHQFAPVTLVSASPYVVTASSKTSFSSIKELIAYAKSNPGKLTFGSSGTGAASHLSAELFKSMARVDLLHVPYKGTGQAITDLLAGQIDLLFAPSQAVIGHVKAGKLTALATTGSRRAETLPDLPTVSEAGVPGYEAVGWFGLLAPAATPKPVVEKLSADANKVLADPETKKRMQALGADPSGNTPDEFARFIRDDQAKWAKLMREAGINPEGSSQNYPAKPIHLIVPFPPGGGNDTVARAIATQAGPALGQPIVIDNRPGAGGIVGAEAAAKAPPDGYTLFLGGVGSHAVNPNLHAKLPYDAVKDFAPITLVASAPSVLVVNPSLPARSVAELTSYARANPGKLNYASNGNGSSAQLAAVLYETMAGVKMVHVPYKGLAPALNDLLGGQVQLMFNSIIGVMPLVQAGRLRALAVTSRKRSALLPDVPTLAESGLAGYEAGSWYGILAPAGTPRAIIERLHAEIVAAVKAPEVSKRLAAEGAEVIGSTPDEFAAHIKAELARMREAIRAGGIRME